MACAGAAVVAYVASGDYKQAAIMAVGVAAASVGAGMATKMAANAVDRAASAGTTANIAARTIEKSSNVVAKVQSKMPGIGVNSKLFGHNKSGTNGPGSINNYGKLKVGWSMYKNGRSTFRIGFRSLNKNRHIDFVVGRKWSKINIKSQLI